MGNPNNRGILIVIGVILLVILAVMVSQGGFMDRRSSIEKAADNVSEAVEDAGDSIGEAAEEVRDEIDDNTTRRQ